VARTAKSRAEASFGSTDGSASSNPSGSLKTDGNYRANWQSGRSSSPGSSSGSWSSGSNAGAYPGSNAGAYPGSNAGAYPGSNAAWQSRTNAGSSWHSGPVAGSVSNPGSYSSWSTGSSPGSNPESNAGSTRSSWITRSRGPSNYLNGRYQQRVHPSNLQAYDEYARHGGNTRQYNRRPREDTTAP